MKQPKIRIDAYLDPSLYVEMVKYGELHQKKNMTQVLTDILKEWKRFSAVVRQLSIEAEQRRIEEMKNAEVVKK